MSLKDELGAGSGEGCLCQEWDRGGGRCAWKVPGIGGRQLRVWRRWRGTDRTKGGDDPLDMHMEAHAVTPVRTPVTDAHTEGQRPQEDT